MKDAWIQALAGGALIGVAATIHLLLSGRIAGVSGIFFGVLKPKSGDLLWRLLFVAGLVMAGVIAQFVMDEPFANTSGRSFLLTAAAGLFVGFGTKLGSGCTSGHGVCGISRMSPRSLAATGTFMATGIVTVALVRLIAGG
jgi:uncharacterized membrane protein YedE/YeeE